MRFTKIKFNGEEVNLEWREAFEDGDEKVTTLKSDEAPARPFNTAMQAFGQLVCTLCSLPDIYLQDMMIRGINIRHSDRGRGLIITGAKPVEHTGSPFVVNTPYLLEQQRDEDGNIPEGQEENEFKTALFQAVDRLAAEAESYLAGHRAQGRLFGTVTEDQEATPA